ncbi:MAG TPA: phosphate ABC transporter permease [Thermosynechococcaceae cyanobacterium]
MLIPLTRETFESLIPAVATSAQYGYYWGKAANVLLRLLISVAGASVVLILGLFLGDGFEFLRLILGITAGLYWLWGPVLWASLRNLEYRRFGYSGFWRGEIQDVFLTEELIGQEETVNDRGDLVIVENRERCLNLVVGDETGFSNRLQVPIKRSYQGLEVGDAAEMLLLSNRRDLGRIGKTTDIYIPRANVWVSDYPYLQREAFVEVSRQLSRRQRDDRQPLQRPSKPDSSKGGALARRPDRDSQQRSSDW